MAPTASSFCIRHARGGAPNSRGLLLCYMGLLLALYSSALETSGSGEVLPSGSNRLMNGKGYISIMRYLGEEFGAELKESLWNLAIFYALVLAGFSLLYFTMLNTTQLRALRRDVRSALEFQGNRKFDESQCNNFL